MKAQAAVPHRRIDMEDQGPAIDPGVETVSSQGRRKQAPHLAQQLALTLDLTQQMAGGGTLAEQAAHRAGLVGQGDTLYH